MDETTIQEAMLCPEYEDTITLEKSNDITIGGTTEQRTAMFKSWARYFAEVENPLKTAANYNKGNYAPLDVVLNTIKPTLSKHGFGIFQIPTYANEAAEIQTMLIHDSGAYILFPALSIPVTKPDAQTVIAATTYGRRGALNAILGIYGEADDDGESAISNGKKGTKKPTAQKTLSEVQTVIDELLAVCTQKKEEGILPEKIYEIIEKETGSKNPMRISDVETANRVKEIVSKITKD